MSKNDELKRLAEASMVANHDERGPDEAFHEALHPEVVLSLIAENERLLKILERTVEQYVPLAELDGVPGWSRVVKLNEVCAERNQLRAEIAGLRTGYQACERVNAELKDEVGALRTALRPLLTHWDDVKPGESMNVDRARSAMRWGECP